MKHSVETRHHREECLGCTDVAGRFLAADVLLTGLQRHAQGWVTTAVERAVERDTDQTTGHAAFVFI